MPRDLDALLDVFHAASEAVEFVRGMTREQFLGDRKTQLAVLHLITIMGEAARRTQPAFRIQHGELPWPQMLGMRNRLVHEYDDVDPWLVWDVLQNNLPPLLRQVELLIPQEEGDTGANR